jgi:hypothetical protein
MICRGHLELLLLYKPGGATGRHFPCKMFQRLSAFSFCVCLSAVSLSFGQASSTPPDSSSQGQTGSSSPTIVNTPAPPEEPAILEDGGFSIQPNYWLNRAQPTIHGGAAATAIGDFNYTGNANASIGGEIGIPTGHSNTLRFSYFRVQGNTDSTLSKDATIFSEAYTAGDYLNANYLIQGAKISWDYLSYTWHKPVGAIRLKTLYEVQLVNAGVNAYAPFKAVITDTSTGNTDENTAHGTTNLILPTFGFEGEQKVGKYFRWEAKASGFGIPHGGDIWDAEALAAVRVNQFEVICGEKGFHFKSSPKSAQYMVDTLSGVFVGLRYYWGAE